MMKLTQNLQHFSTFTTIHQLMFIFLDYLNSQSEQFFHLFYFLPLTLHSQSSKKTTIFLFFIAMTHTTLVVTHNSIVKTTLSLIQGMSLYMYEQILQSCDTHH